MRAFYESFCYGCIITAILIALSPGGGYMLIEFGVSMTFLVGSGFAVRFVGSVIKDIYKFFTEDYSLRG
jgi:hypothetical protein